MEKSRGNLDSGYKFLIRGFRKLKRNSRKNREVALKYSNKSLEIQHKARIEF